MKSKISKTVVNSSTVAAQKLIAPRPLVPQSKEGADRSSDPKNSTANEEVTRTTIDIPKKMYKVVKRLLLEEDVSFRSYALGLIMEDLNRRGLKP
ncbi:hypothetical protein [Paracnuella aquatica]|uniref:hypothetical protein n=1 Tax=Paracnuella aquatica TaxID=2268757 RepID=UPI000DEF8AD4|nr:hypothetical protein [Paracnuella aquatica]RPD44072.1 hypothetical protein DRJ53_18475 [Paracnuella aquatica]